MEQNTRERAGLPASGCFEPDGYSVGYDSPLFCTDVSVQVKLVGCKTELDPHELVVPESVREWLHASLFEYQGLDALDGWAYPAWPTPRDAERS